MEINPMANKKTEKMRKKTEKSVPSPLKGIKSL